MASMARLLSFVVFVAILVAFAHAECQKVCTLEYNPVCAKNYDGELKTFPNLCSYLSAQCNNPSAGWMRTREGEC